MSDLENILKTKHLLEEMAKSIRNILLSRFSSLTASEREDVEQDVKLKLWRAVARGKKIDNLRSYLWKAVSTTALDVLEAKEGFCSLEDEVNHPAAEAAVMGYSIERKMALEKTVELLPPKRKTVVKMYLQGAGLAQIAASLSWSEPKTRHLLYRGLNDIKRIMKSTGPTPPDIKNRMGGGER